MPTLLPAGEAEVRAGPDQLDVREALLDLAVGAVGRAVVDADRRDAPSEASAARRVVAAVPVEHDRDEPHADRTKWAIEPAPGCRSQPAPISAISRATPG